MALILTQNYYRDKNVSGLKPKKGGKLKTIKPSSFISTTITTSVNFAISFGVNYGLFIVLIRRYGDIWGTILSWIISFIIFYSMFLIYAWTKRDWIGIEKIKSKLKREPTGSLFSRILIYANKKGEFIFFVFLSAKLGPFTSLLYMREAYDYSKMSTKDWKRFLLAYVIMSGSSTVLVILFLHF